MKSVTASTFSPSLGVRVGPLKKQRDLFADKGPYSQSCGLSSSHVWE